MGSDGLNGVTPRPTHEQRKQRRTGLGARPADTNARVLRSTVIRRGSDSRVGPTTNP